MTFKIIVKDQILYLGLICKGGSRDVGKGEGGGIDQNVGFNRYEETIKNVLKWQKHTSLALLIKK